MSSHRSRPIQDAGGSLLACAFLCPLVAHRIRETLLQHSHGQCMERWTFLDRERSGCAVTNSGPPWCYLQDQKFIGNPSVEEPGMSWAYCSADGSLSTSPSNCSCKDTWQFKDTTYSGCVQLEEGLPWCVVDGDCRGSAPLDGSDGERFAYCPVVECCQNVWDYLGKSYVGCDDTGDGYTWCKVKDTCKGDAIGSNEQLRIDSHWAYCFADGTISNTKRDMDCVCETHWSYEGDSFKGCTKTGDGPAWCYVTDPECSGSKKSAIVSKSWSFCFGEPTKRIDGNAFCQGIWEYKGNVHKGCADTGHGVPWCFLISGDVPGAKPSSCKKGEHWAFCFADGSVDSEASECDCASKWHYLGRTYVGCAHTDNDGPAWCYVSDPSHPQCGYAKESVLHADKAWQYCFKKRVHCCKESWTYKGKHYMGCDSTDTGSPWCYVKSSECDGAKQSSEASGQYWAYCFADGTTGLQQSDCSCQTKWSYRGRVFHGCTRQEYGPSWCTVKNPKCNHALDMTEDNSLSWSFCSEDQESCCEPHWKYKGKGYSSCAYTGDGAPWCYVRKSKHHSKRCGGFQASELRKGHHWAYCFADGSTAASPAHCSCETQWSFHGKKHHGCAKTNDGPQWCPLKHAGCKGEHTSAMIDKESWQICYDKPSACCPAWVHDQVRFTGCSDAGRGLPQCKVDNGNGNCLQEETNNKLKWCFANGVIAKQLHYCGCAKAWVYKDKLYHGCVKVDDKHPPWCYVDDPSCNGANDEGQIADAWSYCIEPPSNPCCKETWTILDQTFHGCSNVDTGHPWCKVTSETCAGSQLLDSDDNSTTSNVTADNLWAYCQADGTTTEHPNECTCMQEWQLGDDTYYGCSAPDVSQPRWCYVEAKCKGSAKSKLYPDKRWAYCAYSDNQYCKKNWSTAISERTLFGCVDAGFGVPTCYLEDGDQPCAVPSQIDEGQYYAYCYANGEVGNQAADCTCSSKCARTDDGPAWCYVENDRCAVAKRISANSQQSWTYCFDVEEGCCLKDWKYNNLSYQGCAITNEGGHSWCYVKHRSCPGTKPPAHDRKLEWAYCYADGSIGDLPSDCNCSESWTFENVDYKGCSANVTFHGVPWCVVSDPLCLGAEKIALPGHEENFWTHCYVPDCEADAETESVNASDDTKRENDATTTSGEHKSNGSQTSATTTSAKPGGNEDDF